MEKKTIAAQLSEQREIKKITQDKLKQMAGISLDTLRRIEKGRSKNPSHFVITAIEKALDYKFDI